jgi:hypothetical protein
MRQETRPVTVRTRWLMIGENGVSSPVPSHAHVLKCTSVTLAVPAGSRCRIGLLQE